ncbi:division/cell wall cluster transcriptional repressor MraZ [Candidatus Amesbacteria bacterium RIFCSPLOWO2_02_FULL_48_11]|uniref:Transcriptional regulator MraZ n=5 Tax=Candidatus Amesiibacteriota TaxID=1752730 RepID=A0A1F4Z8Q0_9BACT|nr:MAG: Protein MraZ [Candidatus Amesbacteria bacterium GW2011_GWA2_47_11]KKU95043.1 MAG: Protein MraZ [Candidatus Amesbacteria bacterium GW2011_GWC1_48_10]KKW00707.1 MAG: Protein MraZ [Candidatus Amesbacteria bacterium GW2011_GWA1_48_9]OGC90326.1 MAG: division/cell wall cluster transcriptional repressor MraZ [Candidatus Amesbacteria bacterium RBG_19FT_COMBO_48_16]OGC96373.1 MAG: division/cell wall cluster transcriptional repressor MraZ [Candidatus Amesbacteria bacterium RIFCSPHIGHO2_02_FULL_48
MFTGQYEHHLEAKGRLSIPKKFRSQLESGAVICQGLDGCLFLYPKPVWEQLIHKLSQLPLTRSDARDFIRNLSYGASEVDFDRLGRILLPEYLRRFAGIGSDCVITGAVDRVEIWDKQRFGKYSARIATQAEAIAEKLSNLGV